MKAIIIPFHQYVPRGITAHYRIYFDQFKKLLPLWKDEFDHLYLIDHEWDFTEQDRRDLEQIIGERFTIKSAEGFTHWDNLKEILPQVKEDKVLLMDLDTIVYKKGLVEEKFKLLDKYDLVSMFDGSGGMRELIWQKFPFLKEKGHIRFGAYFCFAKRELLLNLDFAPKHYEKGIYLKELDYTTIDGDWLDSFGEATLKILAKNPRVAFIEDDRTSLYMNLDHTIAVWSNPLKTDCYHLRNWNLGLHLINEKKRDLESYEKYRQIVPIQEGCRLLGWLWVIAESVGKLDDNLKNDVLGITRDYGLNEDEWLNFISKFKELHPWI